MWHAAMFLPAGVTGSSHNGDSNGISDDAQLDMMHATMHDKEPIVANDDNTNDDLSEASAPSAA